MRVLHVIQCLSRSGGGPSRSCQGLVAGLNKLGVTAALLSLGKGEKPWIDGEIPFFCGESFETMIQKFKPDVVHLHEIWHPGLHRCAMICRRRKIPYIIAPRGCLEPWSLRQKWLKKRIARWIYQDKDLHCAAVLHATAESEAEQFRRLGFGNPVVVSPNGVNVPKDFSRVEHVERVARRVLFVSRMHPKKGVMELVEAWGRLVVSGQSSVVSGWVCELVYTLNDDYEREYEARVKTRVKELGLEDQFVFTGALDDNAKWNAYASADLFVLPTYSENFGIVVAEALWAGLPVITTKGTPWHELDGYTDAKLQSHNPELKCGWWIDIGVEPLVEALEEAMSLDEKVRREMGERGRKLVEEKYTWTAVVKPLIKEYARFHARTSCKTSTEIFSQP